MRNFLATLIFSQGVPMLLAGDEIAHTQGGNNNVYCQDSEISWLNWDLDEDKKLLLEFAQHIIHLRKAHPDLRRDRFFAATSEDSTVVPDVVWWAPSGKPMNEEDWHAPQEKIVGMSFGGEDRATLFLLIASADHEDKTFRLPADAFGAWQRLIDTSLPVHEFEKIFNPNDEYHLKSHSLVLLKRQGK